MEASGRAISSICIAVFGVERVDQFYLFISILVRFVVLVPGNDSLTFRRFRHASVVTLHDVSLSLLRPIPALP